MKISIEIDNELCEDEIFIKCKEINDSIKKIQKIVSDVTKQADIHFYKENTEYYLSLGSVMFFETAGTVINAHTKDNFYQVKK